MGQHSNFWEGITHDEVQTLIAFFKKYGKASHGEETQEHAGHQDRSRVQAEQVRHEGPPKRKGG